MSVRRVIVGRRKQTKVYEQHENSICALNHTNRKSNMCKMFNIVCATAVYQRVSRGKKMEMTLEVPHTHLPLNSHFTGSCFS